MKYLIAGLGNIGNEYEKTRHNIGFMVLDQLAEKAGLLFTSGRYAAVAEYRYKGRILILIKPSTFMNLSGKAINYWLQKEKIELSNLLVITDDIALPVGAFRMKTKGSDGGHNGLSDIIETLGLNEFSRLRIGIGNDFPKGTQADYVLSKWSKQEMEILTPRLDMAIKTIQSFCTTGADRTMNDFNNK